MTIYHKADGTTRLSVPCGIHDETIHALGHDGIRAVEPLAILADEILSPAIDAESELADNLLRYMPISDAKARAMVPRWQANRQLLESARLIECDGQSSRPSPGIPGESLGYRLGRRLRQSALSAGISTVPAPSDYYARRDKYRRAKIRLLCRSNKTLDWLYRCLDERTSIDHDGRTPPTIDADPERGEDIARQLLHPVRELRRRELLRFGRDAYGRIHTPLTTMWSPLRRRVLIDGGPVVSIDLKNSQPLIFAGVARDILGETPETRDLIALVQQGEYYEWLAAEIRQPRDDAKVELFGWLYGPNTQHARGPQYVNRRRIDAAMRRRFPAVRAAARAVKGGYWSRVPNAPRNLRRLPGGYRRLACYMQMVESAIVIDAAAERCRKAGIPIATVHDSMLCRPADAEQVDQILDDAFGLWGLSPTLKVEQYDPAMPLPLYVPPDPNSTARPESPYKTYRGRPRPVKRIAPAQPANSQAIDRALQAHPPALVDIARQIPAAGERLSRDDLRRLARRRNPRPAIEAAEQAGLIEVDRTTTPHTYRSCLG